MGTFNNTQTDIENMSNLMRVAMLGGARPFFYKAKEDGTRDLYLFYSDPGTKKRLCWVIGNNVKCNDNEVALRLSQIREAMDVPIAVENDFETFAEFFKQKMLQECKNDISSGPSVMDNLARARQREELVILYCGEYGEGGGGANDSLSVRKWGHRESLKETIVGIALSAEAAKGMQNCACKEVVDQAYDLVMADIKECEQAVKLSKQNTQIQRGG